MNAPETLTGPVDVIGRMGLKIGGRWLKFSAGEPTPALKRGQVVRVQHVGGVVAALAVVDPDQPEPQPEGDRQQTLTVRLGCVQAAAAFLAARPDAKREHVVALAEMLETWVTR